MTWRELISTALGRIKRICTPHDPESATRAAEAALRAKRTAQRRDQRARKKVSATVGDTVGDSRRQPPSLREERKNLSHSEGTRISADWKPKAETRLLAVNKFGEEAGLAIIEKFHLHWLSDVGPRAIKADWDAACRKWILNERPPQQIPMQLVGGKIEQRSKPASWRERRRIEEQERQSQAGAGVAAPNVGTGT